MWNYYVIYQETNGLCDTFAITNKTDPKKMKNFALLRYFLAWRLESCQTEGVSGGAETAEADGESRAMQLVVNFHKSSSQE